jgi:hypothetical protein
LVPGRWPRGWRFCWRDGTMIVVPRSRLPQHAGPVRGTADPPVIRARCSQAQGHRFPLIRSGDSCPGLFSHRAAGTSCRITRYVTGRGICRVRSATPQRTRSRSTHARVDPLWGEEAVAGRPVEKPPRRQPSYLVAVMRRTLGGGGSDRPTGRRPRPVPSQTASSWSRSADTGPARKRPRTPPRRASGSW